jgi:hypothetical protein
MINLSSTRKYALAVSVSVAVATLLAVPEPAVNLSNFSIISDVQAANTNSGSSGSGQGTNKGSTGKGGEQGGKDSSGSGKGVRGGNKSIADILAEDDGDDSDRPEWAGGAKELNPHRGDPNPASGTKKGGDYGDLWVILRDDLGNPILDSNNNIQPCLDPACTEVVQLTADGELPPEYSSQVIAVEFGRLNISRSPSKVMEHSLVEALSKLDGGVFGDTVTLDPAGRLVIDGNTIDSPLENLAIYQALLTTPAVDNVVTLSITATAEGGDEVTYSFSIPESDRLDIAASAIAAASDKTGELNVDEIVGISKFLGADDDLASLVADYTYSRTDTYGDVQVWIMREVSPGIMEPVLVNIMDEVEFNDIPTIDGDNDGIDRFTQAAEDAVQVLEFVHDNAVDQ